MKIKYITAGDDHSMFVDENDNVCLFGKNTEGQLGQGHLKDIKHPVVIDFNNLNGRRNQKD